MLPKKPTQRSDLPLAEKGRRYCALSETDIDKFQSLYRERFGKEISREDAYEQGIKLVGLMSIIYKPMTESEFTLIQKHRMDTLKDGFTINPFPHKHNGEN